MAKTYPKRRLVAFCPSDPMEGYVVRSHPEGASQTFPRGAPLAMVSGYLVVFVATGTAKPWGFSVTEGNNTTAGAKQAKYILAVPEVYFFASFLGSSAADNPLAQADFGTSFDLAANADLEGAGVAGWYLQDSTSDVVGKILDAKGDYVFPNVENSVAAVGDINARVLCRIAPTKSDHY